ncbi:MAG: dihydroorotate dehydrogenase electron transfer subunit [Firmicutes bacterium]|nr:dihydroorotate dehydrogenase electron transfer subunit [Bacillota bacterium]
MENIKKTEIAEVYSSKNIAPDIYDIELISPEIASVSLPGQFVEIYPDNGVNILPRPISICEINKERGSLRIVFQKVGAGTTLFSRLKEKDTVRLMGPCGNGYPLSLCKDKHTLLVGGGIGVPPLLEAAKNIEGKKTIVLGYRTSPFLCEEFKKYGDVHVCTDDGSVGFHGNTVAFLEEKNIKGDIILSCGPKIMLKFLSEFAEKNNIDCYVSMEERMACGIGACVGCVVQVYENGEKTYKKVCKDGPVFNSKEVVWQ